MAPYWGPPVSMRGGGGGAAIATGKVTPCIRLQSFIMQTRHILCLNPLQAKATINYP